MSLSPAPARTAPSAILVLPAPDCCGSHAPPCPPLPSWDRAVPELIAPGPVGAVSGATGPTPLALDDQLQPPPSCGLAPAQAESETKGEGSSCEPAPSLVRAPSRTSPRFLACAVTLRARVGVPPRPSGEAGRRAGKSEVAGGLVLLAGVWK